MQTPLQFGLQAVDGAARAGLLSTPHGPAPTPAFMPVATQGSVKALTPDDVRATGASILLANAYHLALRPGIDVVQAMGGLHRFMRWHGPILTDSGGFQAYSLGGLRKVTDDGLLFTSHIDGSQMFLTPEAATERQIALGVDIAMCLDECIAYGAGEAATRAAMERTHRWAQRCLAARARLLPLRLREGEGEDRPALFGIVQGGVYPALRAESAQAITSLPFDGFAAGGLSVGEPKAVFNDIASLTAPLLPAGKPRYLMGVGSPEDLVEAVAAGFDMFDCALPTRVARNGGLYTSTGRVDITSPRFRIQEGPVDTGCDCLACRDFSAGYLHHLFRARELLAYRLASIHNLRFYQRLMEDMRQAIFQGRIAAFRAAFHARYTPALESARLDQRQRFERARSATAPAHDPEPTDP